jgi:hypothetical protein
MGKKVSTVAILVLLGAENMALAEHDDLVLSVPPHTHSDIPLSVTPTLTVPISATGDHTVLRPKPVTMHLSAPIPQIIYSEK